MDFSTSDVLSIFAIFFSIASIVISLWKYIISHAPILKIIEFKEENQSNKYFYLINVGNVKGKLVEIKIKFEGTEGWIPIFPDKDQQILFPNQKSNRFFKIKMKNTMKKAITVEIKLEYKIIRKKILNCYDFM